MRLIPQEKNTVCILLMNTAWSDRFFVRSDCLRVCALHVDAAFDAAFQPEFFWSRPFKQRFEIQHSIGQPYRFAHPRFQLADAIKNEPPPDSAGGGVSFRVVPETIDRWLSSSESGGAD